ncbi:MAG: hypothetical protein ABIJ09_15665 [Pseudomonadota bacterium]
MGATAHSAVLVLGAGLWLLSLACERTAIECELGCGPVRGPLGQGGEPADAGGADREDLQVHSDDAGAPILTSDAASASDSALGVDSSLCGNGQRDPGETCDPQGTCPVLCDDQNACTVDTLSGRADSCTSLCTHVATTQCTGGDGCCPPGCDQSTDSDCPACGALDLRLGHSDVAVNSSVVLHGGGYWSGNRPLILAPRSDGSALVGWYGGDGQVHVTPLTTLDTRAGPDQLLAGDSLRGLVAHDDGFAALVVRGQVMWLVRHGLDGQLRWELALTSSVDQLTEGDTWVDDWGHEGRLLWDGAQYVAYHGETRFWGAQGKHQGDQLVMVDAAGQRAGGGWWWGCSHSLDVRLAHNGTRLGPLCLSDCYPGQGVYFDHQTLVSTENGNCSGSSDAALGGLVGVADGFFVSYAGREGRDSLDVALRFVPNGGAPGEELWLTETPGIDEGNIHLGRYGEHLLLLFEAQAGLQARVLRHDGSTVEGDVSLDTGIAAFNDLVSLSDGDLGWVHPGPDGHSLRVNRLAYCP